MIFNRDIQVLELVVPELSNDVLEERYAWMLRIHFVQFFKLAVQPLALLADEESL